MLTCRSSGIGRSVAVLMAREGADISIVYLPEEQSDAEDTKRMVQAENRTCLLIPGDLRKYDFCRHAVEEHVKQYVLSPIKNTSSDMLTFGQTRDPQCACQQRLQAIFVQRLGPNRLGKSRRCLPIEHPADDCNHKIRPSAHVQRRLVCVPIIACELFLCRVTNYS